MVRKVIQFTDADGFGGAEQIMLSLLAGLDRRCWEPVLLHYPSPGLLPFLDEVKRLGVRTCTVERVQGKQAPLRWWSVVRALRQEQPAIFHAHLNWPLACKSALAAAIVARIPGICATEHSFVDIPWPRSRRVQRLLSLGVDRYIAVSFDIARRMEMTFQLPSRKISVVHNGIWLEPFNRPPDPSQRERLMGSSERPLVLTIARLHTQKGLQYLLESAVALPEIMIVLAGDGPHRAMLEEQARALGIVDRVKFLGHRTDIASLLLACDIFVLPSMFEGLPLSVLEAMAAGKPVIATAVGGTSEAILDGTTGLLVPRADPGALATAIRSLLSDPIRAQALAAAGQARCREEFSALIMVDRVSEIYEAVLAKRGCDNGHN